MEEEKYQKELFVFDQQKKPFSRLNDILPKADFEGRVAITITLEKMVFIFIGIVMLLVLVYALGVESGKTGVKSRSQIPRPVATIPAVTVEQSRMSTIAAKNILNTSPIAPSARPVPITKPALLENTVKPYTISAGSYLKKEGAQASAALLGKQGLSTTIAYTQPYYRVYVGLYASKSSVEAQKDLIKVRKLYKDAVFKTR